MNRLLAVLCIMISAHSVTQAEPAFKISGEGISDQVWIGASTWANRLQDWRIADGRIECVPNRNLPLRTLHLLSHDLNEEGNAFKLQAELGWIGKDLQAGAAGFLLGAGNGEMDYRGASLIHQTPGPGAGIFTGIDHLGRVFIHDNETGLFTESKPMARSKEKSGFDGQRILIACSAKKSSANSWKLIVRALDSRNNVLIGEATATVPANRLTGTIALTADPGQQKKSISHFWFNHWQGSGDRLTAHTDRSFGPVMGTHYTVSRRILKLSAQMAPLPESRLKGAILEIQQNGAWKTLAKADVDPAAFTAVFRVENWDDTQKVSYRVTAPKPIQGEQPWSGTIQKNPRENQEFTVAAFTGNHNLSRSVSAGGRYQEGRKGDWLNGTWFPHADLTANVVKQEPDLLFFSGDQVYESASPSFPDSRARELDYLYKWYLYMWAFRDLTADLPTVCIPDDHDVYQGNFWGQGGRPAKRQNDGGYTAPADFVKMVERTQTANLPDPVDPAPVEQGIGVYFTALNWGPMSFAVIEDRKFKTGPDSEEAQSGNKDKLVLLGDRQLSFLEEWAEDWSDGAAMKASLTATIFSQLHTWRTKSGGIEQDPDTNGWPVNGRNKALRTLRKGYTFMIGGDQHLATSAQHGVDEWGDSGWSICVPSIANYFPRSWKPLEPGKNRTPGMPEHLGEFSDGWGNKVTMHAVANPGGKPSGHQPAGLHDRMPGYGTIHFNAKTREIEMANWPRYATVDNGAPYPGWPITINQTDNYGRTPTTWLPEITSVIENPVVRIFEKDSGKLVYALRIKGTRFRPGVFKEGLYEVKVGDPDTNQWTVHTVKTD